MGWVLPLQGDVTRIGARLWLLLFLEGLAYVAHSILPL